MAYSTMKGMIVPSVSPGSSHRVARDAWTPQVIVPSGAAWSVRAGTTRSHARATTVSHLREGGDFTRTASNQPGRFTASKVWPSLLASQTPSKILEIVRDDVPVRFRFEVCSLPGAVFQRPRDERRGHPLSPRRGQIVVVRRDHHDFSGLETQERHGRAIHLGPRLVAARILRGDDAVPRKTREAGELDHADEARVGERRDDVAALQTLDARDRVGPRSQPPPDA